MPLLEKNYSPGTRGSMPGATAHVDSSRAFVPDQSRAERATSFDVVDFPVPSGREEEWRFTPVDRLRALFADAPSDDRDGDPAASYDLEGPPEAFPGTLAVGQAPRGTALVPADRAAVVASAQVADATYVRIPHDAEYGDPLRIRVHGAGPGRRSNDHLVVQAGRHSRAVLVLEHTGTADHTGNVEVVVGDGADLTIVSIQHWDDGANHLGQHDAVVGRDARYKHIVVTLGGGIVRINTNVRYSGPGGSATLLGVYFADSGQHLEHRSFIDHNTPHCTSLVTYKGALQGDSAHTVWVGDVLIRAAAEGTETYELNRNLVLTDGARADSVTNLEIETGEIAGAGHASATGRFDDEQLFYLMTRGIAADAARRMVVRGFFAEVIESLGVPALEQRLMATIEDELERAFT